MIRGIVNSEGIPCVGVSIHGKEWVGVIDTGFNVGLELPLELKGTLNDEPAGDIRFALGGDKQIVQDSYFVDFPFDGRFIRTIATYVHTEAILIGTMVLSDYRLTIDFPRSEVLLERTFG